MFLGLLAACALIPRNDFKLPDPLFIEFRLDGNPAEGAHQWVIAKVQYLDQGEGDGFWEECNNVCHGRVHDKHDACDFSCDERCPEHGHSLCFEPWPSDFDNSVQLMNKLRQGAAQDKAPDFSSTIAGLIWQDIQKPLDTPDYVADEDVPCWNNKPCSDSWRGYETHWVKIRVTCQYSAAAPNGPRIAGATSTVDLVNVEVPDTHRPIEGSEIDCLCEPIHRIVPPSGQPYFDKYPSGLRFGYGDSLNYMSLPDRLNFKVGIRCENMNTLSLSAYNPTAMPVDIYLEPGTQLVASDSSYQNMMVTKRTGMRIPSWGGGTVSIPVESEIQQKDPMKASGNAVCINMARHEPNPDLTYTAVAPRSTALRLLANKGANDRVVGPWVQTRTWIASDQATFDEVRKVLFPKPTEGIYLRALYEVGTRTHIDFAKDKYKKCMEPRLIVGASASNKATDWFVQKMSKIDPAGLASWVKGNETAFAALFADDAESYAKKHAADVASSLCGSRNADVEASGIDYLMHVPEGKRAELAANGGLEGLGKMLMSDDDAIVGKALGAAEVYKDKSLLFGLMNLSAKASPESKDRASKLAAMLK